MVWRSDNAIVVPLSALFRVGENWAVFRIDDGEAQLKTIKIGQRNSRFAEVKDGLAENDHVVLHPSDRLSDGVRVVEREELQ